MVFAFKLFHIYINGGFTQFLFQGIFRMSGLPAQSTGSFISLSQPRKDQESGKEASPADSKPKKKICCACPETKKLRDECIVLHGEDVCGKWIEAHRRCLRAEGFNV